MAKKDIRIDTYIAEAAEFAQPILKHLRDVVHKASSEIEETIKWGFPHFEYNGRILCSMASFKEHCSFGFLLGSLMKDPHKLMKQVGTNSGMGHFGKIKTLKDLPADKVLVQYIKEAIALTVEGAKKVKIKATAKKEIIVPEYFTKQLKKDKVAFKNFEAFSYSNRKEYVEWITEAKTEDTRVKRIATAVEWLRENKARNWKYMKS